MAGLRYPSMAGLGVDSQGILDSFNNAYDRARAQKQEREFAEMAPRLLGGLGGQPQQPGKQFSLGDVVTGPWGVDQQVNGGNPMSLAALGMRASQTPADAPARTDAATQRIQSALGETSDREAQAMKFFIGKGYSPHQAAGIVGNLIQESNLNTGALNPGDGADGSNSIGLAQWNGSRAQALQAFAAQNGGNASDFNTQLAFIEHELGSSESSVRERLRQAQNPIQAAAAFVGYERPQGWTADNPYNSHGWGNRAKHAARLAGGNYAAPQQDPVQVVDASGQVGVSTQGPFPPAPSGSVFDDKEFMSRAFANPLTRDLAINAGRTRQEALRNANDPMKRIEYQKALIELEKARNPQVTPTDDMREFEFGQQNPAFRDWMLQNNRAKGTTVNVGSNSSKFAEKSDEAAAKRMDEIVASGQSAGQTMADMQQLIDLGAQIGTGKGAQVLATIGPYAQALGIDVENMNEIQAYEAITARLAPQMRAVGSGASSDRDVSMFLQSLPNLRNTQGGNEIIARTMQAVAQNKIDASEIAGAAQRGDISWQDADKQIRALPNPYEAFKKSYRPNGGASPSGASRGAGGSAGRQRARNPQTGQVMEWDGNQWSPVQ